MSVLPITRTDTDNGNKLFLNLPNGLATRNLGF